MMWAFVLSAVLTAAGVGNSHADAGALVQVTPTGGIGASTYGAGQLRIANTSTESRTIQKVAIDLRSAIFPDMVYDPDGVAGDVTAKCVTPNTGANTVGYVPPADPCSSPFTFPHDDGHDVMTLEFSGFDPGEEFRFSIDVDPTSIRGASGSGGAGSVSGVELSGAAVTVEFDGGEVHTGSLFRASGSPSNSLSTIRALEPAAPILEIVGLTAPATVLEPAQTIRVTAPAGSLVRVLQVEGDLDLNGTEGFDLDPYESNTAVAITEYSATVEGGEVVDIPIALTLADGSEGINLLQAVVVDTDGSGRTGKASNTLTLRLDTHCLVDADCADGNPCTDDRCDTEGCANPPSDGSSCDDGIACTSNDKCNAGACVGTGDCPPGEACNPVSDRCESPAISFTKSTLAGATVSNPTSLQFGPDNRLYVAQRNGLIRSFAVTRTSPGEYAATDVEVISLVQQIPNHDDNGVLNPEITERLLTGMVVAGTSQNPVIYLSSSDPRIGGGSSGADKNLDTNSGVLSRLTWDGSQWTKLDLVRGLPRSEENHHGNGLVYDSLNDVILLALGGNTNKGATSINFALLPETALSAAIVLVDLPAIGETTYDLPTLDDEDRPGSIDANDPFGGNNAKNQAVLVPGGPVRIHSPGFRNAYDLTITGNGRLYVVDNGANAGWGDAPVGNGTPNCSNALNEPGSSHPDTLHHVSGPGYYGGHPNPTRANPGNTFNASNPQSPVTVANPIECTYEVATARGKLTTFPASTNGLTHYEAGNFAGQMRGDLILVSLDRKVWRVKLNAEGTAATSTTILFANAGKGPLDVIAQGGLGAFPGTIWVADYLGDEILVYEPTDAGFCTGEDDAGFDEDGDGYSNADELDNGTNPCSSGDAPPDFDGDFISNLDDDDDDNDGLLDNADPFARDTDNGTSTSFPLLYTWENDTNAAGGILNLGFTGLMSNGESDYEDLYDEEGMTIGGAAGVVTIDSVNEGDALGVFNDQEYGFQLGIAVTPDTGVFTVRTRILGPFVGLSPQDWQSMGLFVGDGGQDNYFKIVVAANGGQGGVQSVLEIDGLPTSSTPISVDMPGPSLVELYLTVDPAASTVRPAYALGAMEASGGTRWMASPVPIPAGWFSNTTRGFAAGILSTSRGAAPEFAATWDDFEIFRGPAICLANADCNEEASCTVGTCEDGACVQAVKAEGAACSDGFSSTTDDRCGNGLCNGSESCLANTVCVFPKGDCEAPPGDPDNDGLNGATDPCPFESRNLCAGPVAVDENAGLDIRLNAGVSSAECSGSRIDCNGDVWSADFGFNVASSAASCNLGGGGEGCVISGISSIFGCDSESTEDLFQCEHFDLPPSPNLVYSFAVPDGEYVVNLFFANSFSRTTTVGSRRFDVLVQGEPVLVDFDQVVAAGGSATAVVRASLVRVSGGNLRIEFARGGADNPAIKAIEVIRHDFRQTTTTTFPTTTTGFTTTTVPADCLDDSECTDANPCTADACASGECRNAPTSGQSCDDGSYCNGPDSCVDGECSAHAGDPCWGLACDEDRRICDLCVSLSLPETIRCRPGRDCTVPLAVEDAGFPVAGVGARLSLSDGASCAENCSVGLAASDAGCRTTAASCEFAVVDEEQPLTPFGKGKAADLRIRCTEAGTSQACLVDASAVQTSLERAPACPQPCVDLECGSCRPGDCDGSGADDPQDAICMAHCLLGRTPQQNGGSSAERTDCGCAADCNCMGGAEVSDLVCALRRQGGTFDEDTCEEAPLGPVPTPVEAEVAVIGETFRTSKDGVSHRMPLHLKGPDAGNVGSVFVQLVSDNTIRRVKLLKRLRKAGFSMAVERSDDHHVGIVVFPGGTSAEVGAIHAGPVVRLALRGGSPAVGLARVQYGSTEGLPLIAVPIQDPGAGG